MDDLVKILTENPPHENMVEPQRGFGDAIHVVREAMCADEGLRLAYQATIALALYDTARLSKKQSNEAAGLIMDLLFLTD